EGALAEKLGVAGGLKGLFKDRNERTADDFPLLLGLGNALEPAEKEFRRVHHAQVDLEVTLVERLDVIALALAEEAVVHKHAGQLAADGLVQQRRGDRRVNTAGETEEDAALPHFGADVGHGVGDEILRGPV